MRECAATRGLMNAQPDAFMSSIPSPCISICRMDPVAGLCEGCLRTIDEIAHWSTMDDAQKRAVLAAIAHRRSTAQAGETS